MLIGEASHGTHEFYATRAELTQRLIAEKGFRIVALEADWPDTLRVQRYVADQEQRAIGVIYRPETERQSHYFEACLPEQFDALIHLDETRALEPLEHASEWDSGELPETFPEGL